LLAGLTRFRSPEFEALLTGFNAIATRLCNEFERILDEARRSRFFQDLERIRSGPPVPGYEAFWIGEGYQPFEARLMGHAVNNLGKRLAREREAERALASVLRAVIKGEEKGPLVAARRAKARHPCWARAARGDQFAWVAHRADGPAFGLQPHRTDTFKLSTDPLFVEKVRDVVGLYLNPPERAVVLCVDEKSQIQALDRTQPLLPMRPGQVERHTHDYSFRAATMRNILDFPGQFSPPAEIITLDRNYRSTQPILAAANCVIDLASERFTKNLWTDRTAAERPQLVGVRDETGQACYIVERVLENREGRTMLKQQAVLFLASHHSGPLEVELTRRNIPFVKFGGLKFLDAAHIKEMLALLRFVENPRDRVAGFRVMQLMPGVGPTSAQ
jgi:hypothetical protein